MTEEEIVKAKLRANGVSEKAIKEILDCYREHDWFKGA